MLNSFSSFIYGQSITENNNNINFAELGIELTAELNIGSYTILELADEIARALNSEGDLEYTVSVDIQTRFYTISANGVFDLLISSGQQAEISVYPLLGFTGADLTGLTEYTSNIPSGSEYRPQYKLQKFVDFFDNRKKASASVNQSASGEVEVVSYGNIFFMEAIITYATDIIPQGVIIENPNGVADLREFMNYATDKNKLLFVYDIETYNKFETCILESTPEDRKGTAFKLKELYTRKLAFYFETGKLIFRKV